MATKNSNSEKVTCTSTKCAENLHCFLLTKRMQDTLDKGSCRSCGKHLVDFKRIHKRELNDVSNTFDALKLEFIRHYFWHLPLEQKMVNYCIAKGRAELRKRVKTTLKNAIGPAKPYRDGTQTPRETSKNVNIVHYGQHATATCCRKCLEYWHGIPVGRELKESEVNFLTDLVMHYVDDRLPGLPDEPNEVFENLE